MELKERYLAAKRRLFDIAYAGLNDMQRESVFTVKGPLLVLAGAGSGKTTVLVKRIAFIIKYGDAYFSEKLPHGLDEDSVVKLEEASKLSRGEIEQILPEFINEPCAPWQMLAITFTNKAAGEIKSRLASAFDDESISSSIWAGTFHSVCMRILRKYGDRVGYEAGFTVYDTEDTKKAISDIMKSLNIDDKVMPVKSVISSISKANERLITCDTFETEYAGDYRMRKVAQIYKRYQERLKSCNALDYDDIIMQTIFLLRDNEDARDYYRNKFRYVCVDEYQDTNLAQFELTRILASGYENIMVVGDDDQSIYKFRGADITNILEFDRTYKNAKVIRLEQNYRSTKQILDAANMIISHNTSRKGKTLFTDRTDGEKIKLRCCEDQNAEARYIIDEINKAVASGSRGFKDFAILYRTNAQSQAIERAFAKSGIPYRVLCGQRFNDRKEIKDVLAYLQLINNHKDNERLKRIINEPKRKIGKQTLDAVEQIAAEQSCSMYEIISQADKYTALKRSAGTLLGFAELIDYFSGLLDTDITLEAFVRQVIDRSGYRQMLIDGGDEEKDRLDNIEEFISGVIDYSSREEGGTLGGFLEENALVSEVDKYDDTADAVVMMTIHSAKGLEFPIVFLPGMEDGIFPGMQNILASDAEMEEERRLAYVAVTRAKDVIYIVHTQRRMLYGRTTYNPISRFVKEIPEELIDTVEERRSVSTSAEYAPKTYFSASPRFGAGFSEEKVTVNKPLFAKPAQEAGKRIFKEGDIVAHMTFGRGEILTVKPMGADTLYEIAFDKVGTKKLMATYAKLKKYEG
ncbi:MAG: UvrD-helicase domain-containing protein [Clostridia bacterium]|nr:UvrD-helicase domain-containing protein [Clostridia bacterium]